MQLISSYTIFEIGRHILAILMKRNTYTNLGLKTVYKLLF